jgi:hypothetical protein
MTRYVQIALMLLFAAAITTTLAIEPWISPTPAAATQPVQVVQQVDPALVKQIVQRQLGQSTQFKVRKVAVASSYALVSWSEGEAGGQALLYKQAGTWKILTHGGGWLGAGGLAQAGVPQAIAERLLTQLDPKWRNYEQSEQER